MRMKQRVILLAVVAMAATMLSALAAPERLRVKVIAHGWDTMSAEPEEILRNAELFDAGPYDGVGTMMAGGVSVFSKSLTWTKQGCQGYLDIYRQFKPHKSLRDSFIAVNLQPDRRLSFSDDAAWSHAAENLRVAAWVAKEAGFPGLILDSENYWKVPQFVYDETSDGPDYGQAVAQARRRGREMFTPLFREYPQISLLSFYFLIATPSYNRYYGLTDPAGTARRVGDLWLGFVNGILDAAPLTARLIDGNEDAYWHRHDDFGRSYVRLHRQLQNVIEPENRDKFLSVVRMSHGLYLDMYTNPKSNQYYFGALSPETTRLDTFADHVDMAMKNSDGFVWLYGEQHPFVAWKQPVKARVATATYTNTTWEAALPGFHRAVRFARDPHGELLAALGRAKPEAVRVLSEAEYVQLMTNKSHQSVIGNMRPCGFYGLVGEERGQGTVSCIVPAKGSYEVWKYGWQHPSSLGKTKDGWERFAYLLRVPFDCDGMKLYQDCKKTPGEYRHFKLVTLE